MSILNIIISSFSFLIIFLFIYKSLSQICNIYDKAFQILKKDITNLLIPYLVFAAPFWIIIFYFFANISRATGSMQDKYFYIAIMAGVLSASLLYALGGKVILTASTSLNIMGQKSQLNRIMPVIKGKALQAIAISAFFISLSFITIYSLIPPVLFYLCASLSTPIILLEEERTVKPLKETFSTLFRNIFFLSRLSLAGFLIIAFLFINIITGLYFFLEVLGFFHIIDSHSVSLKIGSPRFMSFCSIITLMFFDFFWTITQTVYFFEHSANRSGKDLKIKLENLKSNETQI